MDLIAIKQQIEEQFEKNKNTIDQLLMFQEQLKGRFQLLKELEEKQKAEDVTTISPVSS